MVVLVSVVMSPGRPYHFIMTGAEICSYKGIFLICDLFDTYTLSCRLLRNLSMCSCGMSPSR